MDLTRKKQWAFPQPNGCGLIEGCDLSITALCNSNFRSLTVAASLKGAYVVADVFFLARDFRSLTVAASLKAPGS